MDIENWWPLLDSSTQKWLINNNGDVVPSSTLSQIIAQAGHPTADTSWVGSNVPEEFYLSDEATDWIEKIANDEPSVNE